jgi:hypothetical protein
MKPPADRSEIRVARGDFKPAQDHTSFSSPSGSEIPKRKMTTKNGVVVRAPQSEQI